MHRRVPSMLQPGLAVLGVVVVAAGLVSAPASATTSTAASAAENTWQVAARLGLGTEDTAVSCPTTTTCWAIEAGELLSSADGGRSWTEQTSVVPADVAALNDVDCPKAALCYLTATLEGGTPEILKLAGGVVTALAVPASAPLPTISCTTAVHCLATEGTTAFVTDDGAEHWATYSLPLIVYTVPALDCVVGTTRCWIVGDNGETPNILRTSDNGQHWQPQTAPATTDGMYDVTCPEKSTCYAVGADFDDDALVIGTHDGGGSWAIQQSPPRDYPLRSVSCATKGTCWASGLSPAGTPFVFATTNAGGAWTEQDLPSGISGGSPYLSCPAVMVCSAVSGGLTYQTVDAGKTWTETEVPAAVGPTQALTCATRMYCVGVSNDALARPAALTSKDGGSTWLRHDMPRAAAFLRDVDCPSAKVCYAISAGTPNRPGAIVTHALSSTDGGVSWHLTKIAIKSVLTQLTCPAITTCLAIGYDRHSAGTLVVTTDGGVTWQPVSVPPGAFYMNGISCTAVTACVLLTQNSSEPTVAWTTNDLGATYEQHVMPDADYYGLSCAGQTCVAVGSDGGSGAIAVSSDGGVTWKAGVVPPEAQILGGVACGSAKACAASGFDFRQDGGPLIIGTTNGGKDWAAYRVPARREQPIDVACVGASCIASDVSPAGNPLILAGRA